MTNSEADLKVILFGLFSPPICIYLFNIAFMMLTGYPLPMYYYSLAELAGIIGVVGYFLNKLK